MIKKVLLFIISYYTAGCWSNPAIKSSYNFKNVEKIIIDTIKDHNKTSDSNLILLERGKNLYIKATQKSEFLFIAGKPIGEPIARGGPFVMNTKNEILEAIQDYNNGTFAKY